jgi:hypothetical protein
MPLSMSDSRRAVENLVSAYNEIQQDPCHGLIQSAAADGIGDRTSREGGCGEYAVADRLIGRLKRERIAHRDGTIRRDVSDDERDGAEMCYNSTRTYSYRNQNTSDWHDRVPRTGMRGGAVGATRRVAPTAVDAHVHHSAAARLRLHQSEGMGGLWVRLLHRSVRYS